MAGFHGTIISEQYPATVAMQCVMIVIPEGDEYLRLLAGLLNLAGEPSSYDDPESAQTDGLCFAWDESYFLTDWLNCGEPPGDYGMNSNLRMLPPQASVGSGNAFLWVSDTAMELAGYWQQNPAATGDDFRWYFWIGQGTYSFTVTYLRNTNAGRSNVEIWDQAGGSGQRFSGSFDQYGTAQRNTRYSNTFVVAVGGEHTFRVIGNGKNAASSAFVRGIARLDIERIG